ncbi:hypothetical protein OIU78_024433 [Salix suchowensis]|nr:hypothetical protein OIU78_024433 [Salix suchowensis]
MEVLALAKAQKPADQTVMLYKDCIGKGNYTTNSTYHANLNKLLTSIYTSRAVDKSETHFVEQVRDGSTIRVYFLPDFKFVQVFEISSLLLLRIPSLSSIGLPLVWDD